VKHVLSAVCAIIVLNTKENGLMRHFHKGMIFTVGFNSKQYEAMYKTGYD